MHGKDSIEDLKETFLQFALQIYDHLKPQIDVYSVGFLYCYVEFLNIQIRDHKYWLLPWTTCIDYMAHVHYGIFRAKTRKVGGRKIQESS